MTNITGLHAPGGFVGLESLSSQQLFFFLVQLHDTDTGCITYINANFGTRPA